MNVTVATPLAFVVLVAVENEPPPVLDQVTTRPDVEPQCRRVATCAEMVTAAPGTGAKLLEVTRNSLATRNVTVLSVLVEARLGWFPLTLSARSAAIVADGAAPCHAGDGNGVDARPPDTETVVAPAVPPRVTSVLSNPSSRRTQP